MQAGKVYNNIIIAQRNNMKDENTIREVIHDLCKITNKEISKEKEDKIISAIINDKVPKNVDKMF